MLSKLRLLPENSLPCLSTDARNSRRRSSHPKVQQTIIAELQYAARTNQEHCDIVLVTDGHVWIVLV
ncbi:hypothetical protein L596_001494 [Steinernema carpocapsae]|uniref:Uncharacterized protein n=1 Tax=Steinernema carpocapsae TaxID=34508 RepID=A0A4U8UNZ4_STECR|nr:hypothetical protein L596_001494 [Steinernema carpocapsae]